MLKVITAALIILVLLFAWLMVLSITRNFSKRHPELGIHKEEGEGCGESCSCINGKCHKEE
jgi:hypothetical protein